jgi:glycosyltransferase involved in cell wall biosynthesis
MDVFVLPSVSEGMSNTLLEAMAAGVPVLASDVGGNVEIVESGRSGLLFRSGDEDHAAAQLLRLTNDAGLRIALGREGASKVGKDFSIAAMLQSYAALYRRVWGAGTVKRQPRSPVLTSRPAG